MANLWFLLLLHLTGVSVTTSQMCDTVIRWDYNGTIESPGFPHEYYGNQYCWYYFSLPNTFCTWRISFTYFNLPNTSCDSDFIEVYSNSPPQTFCQNSTPPDLTGVHYILFYSNLNASAGFGFQANVSMELECGNPNIRLQENISYSLRFRQDYPMPGRCEWEVTADQGLAIMMIGYFWYIDNEPINRSVKMYRGPIKDESSLITIKSQNNMIAVDEASNSILIEYIANYTSYFDLSMTFLATKNSTCGSVTNASAGDIYLSTDTSDYTSGYHRNGICVWTIEAEEDEVIQLLITELYIRSEIPGCNDSARSYLEIYDGSQTNNSLLVRACSADELHGYNPVTSTTRRLVVVLTLDEELGFTRASFTTHYKSFNQSAFLRDCGGDISGDEGVVSSPNYPANYDNLRECEWRITVEDLFNIRIDIHDLDIRPSYYGCAGDFLLITGAYPSGQIYRFCGSHDNNYGLVIYSASNNLTMRFVSDWENNGRGFNASWRKACDLPLETSSGWIQSLRFPATYLDNLSCSYFIGTHTYRPGISYIFTFETFDLQEPDSNGSCIYDYLEILQVPAYNPGYFVPPEAKKVCGKRPTENLTTYFPTTLHFVTDGSITKGGFNISFVSTMAGCGESLLVEQKGFITSPNHPGTFPQFLRCNTTIRVQPGHRIILTFTSFFLSDFLQTDNGPQCWWRSEASLDIYDSLSTGSAWIGTYCGYTAPRPITSTSNELSLSFRSSYNNYATGFSATYVSIFEVTGNCRFYTFACPNIWVYTHELKIYHWHIMDWWTDFVGTKMDQELQVLYSSHADCPSLLSDRVSKTLTSRVHHLSPSNYCTWPDSGGWSASTRRTAPKMSTSCGNSHRPCSLGNGNCRFVFTSFWLLA